MVDWKSPNIVLALVFILSTLCIFAFVIEQRLGGDQALFLIIGHTAAWVEMIAIFFFRKSPPTEPK
jgi:hypothetical protein